MRNQGASKLRGGLLLALGLFLLGFTAWIGFSILPAMAPPGLNPGGSSFTGSPEQGSTILALLGALMAFAATAAAYGAYMLVTGRRNRLFMLVCLLLFALLAWYGWTIAGWEA